MTKQAMETMIDKCEERIESFRKTIAYYEKLPGFEQAILHYYTRWKVTLLIKQRLEKYHQKIAV